MLGRIINKTKSGRNPKRYPWGIKEKSLILFKDESQPEALNVHKGGILSHLNRGLGTKKKTTKDKTSNAKMSNVKMSKGTKGRKRVICISKK